MAKVKLRLTLVVEYTSDSEYYGTEVPAEMAAIDESVFRGDPETITYLIDGFEDTGDGVTVRVEPAE